MPKAKKSISPTAVDLYLRCGEAYRRRYICGDVIPPGIALVKGTSVHKGIEHNFKQKIDSRVDVSPDEVVDVVADTFDETIKHEGILLNTEETAKGKSITIGQGKDSATRLARIFMAGDDNNQPIAPRYQPKSVEDQRVVSIPNSSHDLKGIIDLQTDDGRIVDFKTSTKSWTQERLDRDMQFGFYGLINQIKNPTDGNYNQRMVLENLVDGKAPKVITLETERSIDDHEVLIDRINRVLDGINKSIYPPAPSDSWKCSPRFCGYWDTCKLRPRR